MYNKTGHENYNIKFIEKNDEDLFGVVTKGSNDIFVGISQEYLCLCVTKSLFQVLFDLVQNLEWISEDEAKIMGNIFTKS